MKIEEAIINRFYETVFGEICFGVKVKEGELTEDEIKGLKAAWRLKTPLSFGEIKIFQSETNEDIVPAYGLYKGSSELELHTDGSYTKTIEIPVKLPQTIYQKFKRICIEYSGESYYQRVKKHLGVEHLREIGEKHKMSESMVDDVFRLQMNFIDNCMKKKSVIDISSLTHKDNAVLKWKQLFEIFNLYNKNEANTDEAS